MQAVKEPAVSGSFYSSDRDELTESIHRSMENGFQVEQIPKAIIAPHAGYIYSGEIAGSAYSVLPKLKDKINRVILLGPCHRVPVKKFAVAGYSSFKTPLGDVPVNQIITNQLLNDEVVELNDMAFAQEHSLEVHLPFLQHYLTDFQIVPILVGRPSVTETSQLLERLYGDDSTLIVISSDLSHYLDYKTANDIDMLTSQQIVSLDYQNIKDDQACGRYPVKGLLHLSQKLGLTARAIDLRNSGDTQGDKSRVVGYGAYHFYEPNESLGFYSNEQRNVMRTIVKQTIIHGIQTGGLGNIKLDQIPLNHTIHKATFVTLQKQGQLRGCIGSLEAHQPLAVDLAHNAFKAAFQDPRFDKVREEELAEINFSISILSDPVPIDFQSEQELIASLRKTIDGLIIQDQNYRAIFLPSVWESIHDPVEFLTHLKVKAGLSANHWSDSFKAYRLIADKF